MVDQSLTFQRSRLKIAGFVGGAAAFVGFGWLLTYVGDDWFERGMGWVTIAFFGAVFLSASASLFRRKVVFVLDRNAITDSGRGIVIPWNEVREVLVVNVRGQRFLSLAFKNREVTLARASMLSRKLAELNERMGWGEWTFNFTAVSPGIDEALEFIRENVPDVRV
jgi:hypothetical protein